MRCRLSSTNWRRTLSASFGCTNSTLVRASRTASLSVVRSPLEGATTTTSGTSCACPPPVAEAAERVECASPAVPDGARLGGPPAAAPSPAPPSASTRDPIRRVPLDARDISLVAAPSAGPSSAAGAGGGCGSSLTTMKYSTRRLMSASVSMPNACRCNGEHIYL